MPRQQCQRGNSAATSSRVSSVFMVPDRTVLCMVMHSHMSLSAGQRCLTIFPMSQPPRFDPNSVVPLYVQAADYVAGLIESGELRPGDTVEVLPPAGAFTLAGGIRDNPRVQQLVENLWTHLGNDRRGQ